MPSPPPSTRTRWDPPSTRPIVWLVGSWDAAEFAVVRTALVGANATEFAAPDAARQALLNGAAPPEAVLLAQPRPGCWPQSGINALQAAAPLARIVIVAGTWCEGEPRTGQPLVAAARIYWHELPAWWRESMARRGAGLAPHWSRLYAAKPPEPPPAEPEPRPLEPEPCHPEVRRGVRAQATLDDRNIAIDSPDFAVFETLAAALRPSGAACLWMPRGRGKFNNIAAGLFDGSQLDVAEVTDLRRFCERFARRPTPVIVLLDFPRAEHFAMLRDLGASALVGKPYSVAALVDELARIAIDHESPKDPPALSPWRGGLGRREEAGTTIANGLRVPSAFPLP